MFKIPGQFPPALITQDATAASQGLVAVQQQQNNVVHGQLTIMPSATSLQAGEIPFEVPDGVYTLWCTLVGSGAASAGGGGGGAIIYEFPINVQPGMSGRIFVGHGVTGTNNGNNTSLTIGGWTLIAGGGDNAGPGGVVTITDPKGNSYGAYAGYTGTATAGVNFGPIGQGSAGGTSQHGIIVIKW